MLWPGGSDPIRRMTRVKRVGGRDRELPGFCDQHGWRVRLLHPVHAWEWAPSQRNRQLTPGLTQDIMLEIGPDRPSSARSSGSGGAGSVEMVCVADPIHPRVVHCPGHLERR